MNETQPEEVLQEIEKQTKLTVKQREWLRLYFTRDSETFGNATQSAIKAYQLDPIGQYHSARNIGAENVAKLGIQMSDLMDAVGLDDGSLADKLSEATNADRPIGAGEKMQFVPDNQARNKALEMALKVKKKLIDKVEIEGGLFSSAKLEVSVVDENPIEPQATPDPATAGQSSAD